MTIFVSPRTHVNVLVNLFVLKKIIKNNDVQAVATLKADHPAYVIRDSVLDAIDAAFAKLPALDEECTFRSGVALCFLFF